MNRVRSYSIELNTIQLAAEICRRWIAQLIDKTDLAGDVCSSYRHGRLCIMISEEVFHSHLSAGPNLGLGKLDTFDGASQLYFAR